MIHHYVNESDTNNQSSEFFAVGSSFNPKKGTAKILVEVSDGNNSARIRLSVKDAKFLVHCIQKEIEK